MLLVENDDGEDEARSLLVCCVEDRLRSKPKAGERSGGTATVTATLLASTEALMQVLGTQLEVVKGEGVILRD